MLKTKKTAIDLTDLALGIIVLGIVVTIGTTILLNMRDNSLTSQSVYSTTQNITASNSTGTELSSAYFKGLTSVVNASNVSQAVPSSNYTTTLNTINGKSTFLIDGPSAWNAQNVTITYDAYNTSGADYALANNAAVGLAEYGSWFKIIVIVGVAAVILALIFMAFGRGAGSVGSSSSY